ncbi:unnamed protein product [Lactuca saligna]|uniref:Uncharacterized protein n=1 Tax=Lactuca saligna TaxID=75948 RepID=A0AA36E948_LACSI|nr:unnamed protein product [Lactuca saligna]
MYQANFVIWIPRVRPAFAMELGLQLKVGTEDNDFSIAITGERRSGSHGLAGGLGFLWLLVVMRKMEMKETRKGKGKRVGGGNQNPMAMAMTNLLLKPPSMIIAPKHKHTQQPPLFRFERCSVYTPPTSSFKIPRLHLSLTRPAIPISDISGQLVAKEVKTVNSVAETKGKKDDKQEAKRKSHKTRRMSGGGGGGNLSPKVYAIIVGASFCVVVAIFCIVIPKQQASRCIVVPYSDLVDSIDDGSVIHVRFVEDSKQFYYNTKSSNETPQTKSGGPQGLLNAFVPTWQYNTTRLGDDVVQLIKVLKDKKITYSSGSVNK